MKTLILHLGLHKTATTYFQRSVWPNWPGVTYLGKPTPKGFKSPWDALERLPGDTFLISSEGSTGSLTRSYLEGQSWLELCRQNLTDVSRRVPEGFIVKPILSLRDPEQWAISIYKHYLKYGGVDEIDEFFGMAPGVPATCPLDQLDIDSRIGMVEQIFMKTPFTFYTEEITNNPHCLRRRIADYCNTENTPTLPFSRLNEGVGERGSRLCLTFNRNFINRGHQKIGHLYRTSTQAHTLLKAAKKLGLFRETRDIKLPDKAVKGMKSGLNKKKKHTINLG